MLFKLFTPTEEIPVSSPAQAIAEITRTAETRIKVLTALPADELRDYVGDYGEVRAWMHEFKPQLALGLLIDAKQIRAEEFDVYVTFAPMAKRDTGFHSLVIAPDECEWECLGWFNGSVFAADIEDAAQELGETILDDDQGDCDYDQYDRLHAAAGAKILDRMDTHNFE